MSLVTQHRRTTPVPTVHPQSLFTTFTQTQFYEKTFGMVDIINDPNCPRARRHRELDNSEAKKGEESVQRVLDAVRNFTNPFTVADKNRIYSLASGAPVPMEVNVDVLRQKLWARLLKLTSSDTYRAESLEVSSTISRRRNSRPWRLATRRLPSHYPRER